MSRFPKLAAVAAVLTALLPGAAQGNTSPTGCYLGPAAAGDAAPAALDLVANGWIDTHQGADALFVDIAWAVASLDADPVANIPAGAQSITWELAFKNNNISFPGIHSSPYVRVSVDRTAGVLYEHGHKQADGYIRWVPATGSLTAGSPGYIRISQHAPTMTIQPHQVMSTFVATSSTTPLAGLGVATVVDEVGPSEAAFMIGHGIHTCISTELPAQPTAKQADLFAESVGVNTHFTFNPSHYRDWPNVERVLTEAGIRYVRDMVPEDPAVAEQYRRLSNVYGIRTNVITSRPSLQTVPNTLSFIKALGNAVVTIEGNNEPDNSPPEPGFPTTSQQHQRDLYTAVKADPQLASIPVLGPSLANHDAYYQLGDLSNYLDLGAVHAYGRTEPASRTGVLDPHLELQKVVAGNKPVHVTESGWSDIPTGSALSVSTRAQGAYIPKMLLTNFAAGVERTYIYELLDEVPWAPYDLGHFGLVRHDFTPKPSYTAVKNLMTLLSDPGPAFTPGTLQHTVDSSAIQHVLLQKRDGSFWLALWHDARLYTPEFAGGERIGPGDLYPADKSATVTLNSPMGAKVYEIADGTSPVSTLAASSQLTLTVPADDVVLLELTPPPAPTNGSGKVKVKKQQPSS